MEIEAKDFTIKLTHDELWSICFDVRHALEYTLKTHWINHQSKWEENEKERLNRLKKIATSLGRPDVFEDIYRIAKDIFEKHNNKK